MLFKITSKSGASIPGGTFVYPLPTGGEPGAWVENPVDLMRRAGAPAACNRGYHLVPAAQVMRRAEP